MKRQCLGIILGVISGLMRTSQGADTLPAPPPDPVQATLMAPDEWIVGTPLWARVTVRVEDAKGRNGPAIYPSQLPFCYRAIEWQLKDAESHTVVDVSMPILLNPNRPAWPTQIVFAPNSDTTYFLRLQSPENLPAPGKYTLIVLSGDETSGAHPHYPASAQITLRAPNDAEKPFVADVASLWRYPFDDKAPQRQANAPESIRKALAVDWYLHDLLLNQVGGPSAPDVALPDYCRPAMEVMDYQILLEQAKVDEADKLKASILKATPGIRWMIDAANKGPKALTPLHQGRGAIGTVR